MSLGSTPLDEDALRQLAGASVGRTPEGIEDPLFVPRPGTFYHYGTSVPIVGIASWIRLDSGLIVPASAAVSGPLDHVGVYVTLDEYLDIPPGALVKDTVRRHSAEELIIALAALNHYLGDKTAPPEVVDEFLSRLKPKPATRLRVFMNQHPAGSVVLAGRQSILTAMKHVIGLNVTADLEPVLDVATAALMMSHAAGTMIRPEESSDYVLGNVPQSFFMDMVRLILLHNSGDPYGLIERNSRAWTLDDDAPRSNGIEHGMRELVRLATGLEIEDIWALGFALYAFVLSRKPDAPFVLKDINSDMPSEILAAFQQLVSADADLLRREIGDAADPWNFYALERFPVFRVSTGLVVLDEEFLLERITNGVYWDVFGYLREIPGGENLHLRWAEAFSGISEQLLEQQLNGLRVSAGGVRSSYDEHDLQRAYPGRQACDLCLDFGTHWCLFEIVRRDASFKTRAHGDFDQFKTDIERSIVGKAQQLNDTVGCLAANEADLTGSAPVPNKSYQPVVIVAGRVPSGPHVEEYIKGRLEAEDLLRQPRVLPLAVLDLQGVELLEALAQAGHLVGDVLREWKASPLTGMPFPTFVSNRFGQLPRAARIQEQMDQFTPMLLERLQLKDDPGREGAIVRDSQSLQAADG